MVDQVEGRKSIGARLRLARETSGVSAKTVYEQLEITRAGFYHWETGKSAPSIDQLLVLCQIYRTSAGYVLTGKSEWPFDHFTPYEYKTYLTDQERKEVEATLYGKIMMAEKKNGTNK